eukprot:1159048-Pelagomonas_calceolata.AAC.5
MVEAWSNLQLHMYTRPELTASLHGDSHVTHILAQQQAHTNPALRHPSMNATALSSHTCLPKLRAHTSASSKLHGMVIVDIESA